MPVQDNLVRFQLSGGNANENPNLSLGGQISVATNRNIVSNFLHGFFDEVTNTEAVSGEYEYRHFYYRNSHDFKVRNVRLIVIADQTSIWSKIEFAKGTANNGSVEQAIANENIAPVGISETNWKIPNATTPLILGEVEAGSTASVWCRRKVEPGALIAKNEKVTIRIIADPPVPVAPPITCGSGTHYDSTTNTCVPNEEPPDPDCPAGQHRDTNGNCVPNTGTPCPQGQHMSNGQCVPDGSPPPPTPVKMAIVGDIGCNSTAESTLFNIGLIYFNLLAGASKTFIANGDLSYSSNSDCFEALIEHNNLFGQNPSVTTKISIGNHDDEEEQSTRLRNDYISYFGIPSQGYYSFNIQNIHVLIMDTQSSYSTSSAQYAFVRNDLIAASQNASIDWILVCYHKPSLTAPSDHSALTDFRDIYHPMFDTYQVDMIFASHNHNMQRTYMIRHNPSNPSNPTIVNAASSKQYLNKDNFLNARMYFVVGSGGRALDSISSKPAYMDFIDDENFGFLKLEWSENNKKVTGRFVTLGDFEDEINDLDVFSIDKTKSDPF